MIIIIQIKIRMVDRRPLPTFICTLQEAHIYSFCFRWRSTYLYTTYNTTSWTWTWTPTSHPMQLKLQELSISHILYFHIFLFKLTTKSGTLCRFRTFRVEFNWCIGYYYYYYYLMRLSMLQTHFIVEVKKKRNNKKFFLKIRNHFLKSV